MPVKAGNVASARSLLPAALCSEAFSLGRSGSLPAQGSDAPGPADKRGLGRAIGKRPTAPGRSARVRHRSRRSRRRAWRADQHLRAHAVADRARPEHRHPDRLGGQGADPRPVPGLNPDPVDPGTAGRAKRLTTGQDALSARCDESRTAGWRRGDRGKRTMATPQPRPRSHPTSGTRTRSCAGSPASVPRRM
jgi:hypothetical protein